ncbi:hypothetical protein QE432_002199 [Agrobacterium sp. SORGH_AS 745]|nr:hypothetical protein [Agrobacterium tumefaciens]MDQ1220618.1 hypothetical protein [Agrobacterium sp. SORGH_AS_0745]
MLLTTLFFGVVFASAAFFGLSAFFFLSISFRRLVWIGSLIRVPVCGLLLDEKTVAKDRQRRPSHLETLRPG